MFLSLDVDWNCCSPSYMGRLVSLLLLTLLCIKYPVKYQATQVFTGKKQV